MMDEDGTPGKPRPTPPVGPMGPAGPAGDGRIYRESTVPLEVNGAGLLRLQQSVSSAAQAADLGQAFAYRIEKPVTLPRQQSALLPIVTGGVGAWRLSIYNPAVQEKYPLYGMRLRNTLGVHLMGGPVTVYHGETYAGDATFDDLQPGEDRLLSYAVDQGMLVERKEDPQWDEIIAFKVVRGQLVITRNLRRNVHYTAAVKDGKDRKLMIEHAYLDGWELLAPAKAEERTDRLYRFTLAVPAKETVKLTVTEGRVASEATLLTSYNTETLVGYMQNGRMSAQVRDALKRVADMQIRLTELRRKRSVAENEIREITNEQTRIRANMGSLDRNSDLYRRYVTKLGEQETRIEQLRTEIESLTERENALRRELDDYVTALSLD